MERIPMLISGTIITDVLAGANAHLKNWAPQHNLEIQAFTGDSSKVLPKGSGDVFSILMSSYASARTMLKAVGILNP